MSPHHVVRNCFILNTVGSGFPVPLTHCTWYLCCIFSFCFNYCSERAGTHKKTLPFQCYSHVRDCSTRRASTTRNRETTVYDAFSFIQESDHSHCFTVGEPLASVHHAMTVLKSYSHYPHVWLFAAICTTCCSCNS